MSVSKSDIVKKVAKTLNISQDNVHFIVRETFTEISNSLAEGEDVRLKDFGSFSTTDIAEKEGRNPKTGEPLTIAAHKRLKFKPSSVLKSAVNS